MLYKKPKISYTAMCIYIDKFIHDPDNQIQQTCFEYIWNLFYILAVKGKMFLTAKDYDEYALYGATQLYMRYKKEEKDPNLKPIKSCLNYIKRILYPLKVNYQKANFGEVFQEESLKDSSPEQIYEDKVTKIRHSTNDIMSVEYTYYINNICSTIKNFLKDSPYNKDKSTMHNIYLSCLLTLLKTMTMSNKNKARLKNKEDKSLPTDVLMEKIYAEEQKDDIVVFHLDPSMSNYIATLVNRLKKEIVKDLRYIVGSFEPSKEVIDSVLMSPLEEILTNEQY